MKKISNGLTILLSNALILVLVSCNNSDNKNHEFAYKILQQNYQKFELELRQQPYDSYYRNTILQKIAQIDSINDEKGIAFYIEEESKNSGMFNDSLRSSILEAEGLSLKEKKELLRFQLYIEWQGLLRQMIVCDYIHCSIHEIDNKRNKDGMRTYRLISKSYFEMENFKTYLTIGKDTIPLSTSDTTSYYEFSSNLTIRNNNQNYIHMATPFQQFTFPVVVRKW